MTVSDSTTVISAVSYYAKYGYGLFESYTCGFQGKVNAFFLLLTDLNDLLLLFGLLLYCFLGQLTFIKNVPFLVHDMNGFATRVSL